MQRLATTTAEGTRRRWLARVALFLWFALTIALFPGGAGGSGGPAPTLTIKISGRGKVLSSPKGISCPFKCHARFFSGSRVALEARPAAGWSFRRWSGLCRGRSPCTLTLKTRGVAVAVFQTAPRPSPPKPPGPQSGHYAGSTAQSQSLSFDVTADRRTLTDFSVSSIDM